MRRKFRTLSFFFLLITFLSNYSWAGESANGPQCYDLFKQIKNEWREKDLWAGETENFFDYGFEVLDEKGTIENIERQDPIRDCDLSILLFLEQKIS